MQFPIIIICRDRFTHLSSLVSWFEKCGQQRIYLLDNNSTYEPLLDYYKKTPHQVIQLPKNIGHKSPWKSGILKQAVSPGEYFVISDPDVIPIEECPLDALSYFYEVLQEYPDRIKCGFGLKIDDVPNHYQHKNLVIEKESKWWKKKMGSGLFDAQLDTTFALYRPGQTYARYPAIRTDFPYLARHMPWYMQSDYITTEDQFYRDHLNASFSHWNLKEYKPSNGLRKKLIDHFRIGLRLKKAQ